MKQETILYKNEEFKTGALKYLRLKQNEKGEVELIDSDKKETFEKFDLFYYVQVILKFLRFEYDDEIMKYILQKGADVNYLSEYNENALFKVK